MEYQAFEENKNEQVVFNEFQQMMNHVGDWQRQSWRCKVRKVLPELRQRVGRHSRNVYDPLTVSIGPYHHGKPELSRAEEFKHVCLNWCARNMEPLKSSYYNLILNKINVIRECYTEVTIVNKYNDSELAKMILLDACFIVNFMENITPFGETNNMNEWYRGLGVAPIYAFTFRDLMLLENQIPFPVLTMLIKLKYDDHGKELIELFLRTGMMLEKPQLHTKWKASPMHLLQACRRLMVEKHQTVIHNEDTKFADMKALPVLTPSEIQMLCICRSVMDLKAKGIVFKPSSNSLTDIKFKSGTFYGHLHLPTRPVSDQTLVILSNMIAYEVSPNVRKLRPSVLSYVIFMKSLIQSTEDVKELQEKGILINRLANVDQVVRVFEEIDTFGLIHIDAFIDIRSEIEKHCSSKAKTWMADLFHSRFKSPWTTITLFAAAFLLCFTFLQTFFTIHPLN